jgi:hypothetical protein
MLKENIAQKRHIEIERLTFLSLEFIGVCTLVAANLINNSYNIIICIVLFLLNIVCSCLLARWAAVYRRRDKLAEKIESDLRKIVFNGESCSIAEKYKSKIVKDKEEGAVLYCTAHNNKLNEQIPFIKKIWGDSTTARLFGGFNALVYFIIIVQIIKICWPEVIEKLVM